MGFLKTFGRSGSEPARLPSGAFTIDAEGDIVSSTLPRWVPEKQVRVIGQHVLAVFAGARNAQLQFSEVVIQYGAFKITAREMRGGAMIFLSPKVSE
jgi:hypothetical protein